ncbi:MAG: sugar ABC transporter permease [Candidatus Omnitrophica bacterium]|nr:sugar ABC transporter permease [Candidatus Omnitrophota bacterium]
MSFQRLRSTLENYLFILPAVTIFTIFYIIPFFWVFQLSLFKWDGIAFTKTFVGLRNFMDIFSRDSSDPLWWRSIAQAGYITLFALTFQNALAFLLALACDREIKLKNFYRVVFFIPPVLSEVVVGMVWRLILNDIDGANLLNRGLIALGLENLTRHWIYDQHIALTTVAIVHSWKGFGWGFLIFLAGLQTIPKELYEAARVDGANAWQQFLRITLPLMVPVIILVGILTVLGTMQAFVLVKTLIQSEVAGSISVPVLRILNSMNNQDLGFGYACAQGLTFGILLVIISFVQNRISKKFSSL